MRHVKPHPAPANPGDLEKAIDLGLERLPRTELGHLLLAARREFFVAEGRFLDRHDLDPEVAERRGGASADGDD